ncbi:MAG: hypothetical protein JO290_10810 [Sphingomonadaceae bacterium]|nr:hypothetical protein [Sphingomonadaceae bacterium]
MMNRAAVFFRAVLIGLVSMAAAVAPEHLSVESIGNRQWRLTLVQDQTTDVDAAQSLLAPRAMELCGNDPVRAGHYRFEYKEAVTPPGLSKAAPVMTLVQDISCGSAEAVAPSAAVAVQRSDAEATDFGLAIAKRYIAARDSGDVARVVAMVSPDSGIAAVAEQPDGRRNLGKPIATPRYKVTLYRDPPNAPGPGLYIAVDFALAYTSAPAVCGYIIIREPPGGVAMVTREERGVLDAATARKMRPADMAAVRQELLCNVP